VFPHIARLLDHRITFLRRGFHDSDDDTTSWASWNLYAEQLAHDTGACVVRISDGGITGSAFFDHVRRSRRPIISGDGSTQPTNDGDVCQRS
jgi:hypothetical protein